MCSNFRANERRGSSLAIPNAAESQEHLILRFREEVERNRFARHPNENLEKNPKLSFELQIMLFFRKPTQIYVNMCESKIANSQ